MLLQELEPRFVRYASGTDPVREYLHRVDALAEAQGVIFLCPTCFTKNNGPVGTHKIQVSFTNRGVEDRHGSHNREGAPSRWNVSGSGYADLTLTPSVDAGGGWNDFAHCWHGFITNGEVTNA